MMIKLIQRALNPHNIPSDILRKSFLLNHMQEIVIICIFTCIAIGLAAIIKSWVLTLFALGVVPFGALFLTTRFIMGRVHLTTPMGIKIQLLSAVTKESFFNEGDPVEPGTTLYKKKLEEIDKICVESIADFNKYFSEKDPEHDQVALEKSLFKKYRIIFNEKLYVNGVRNLVLGMTYPMSHLTYIKYPSRVWRAALDYEVKLVVCDSLFKGRSETEDISWMIENNII